MLKKINQCMVLGAVLAVSFTAQAQSDSSRPVRMIVPYTAGGATDATIRMIADRLRIDLGQSIIVENKPGAGTAIGSDHVAQAEPDGTTLLYAGSSLTMLPAISKVNYDPVKDFTPVSSVINLALYLVVRPDLPVNSVAELTAYLKANPGSVNYGSVGTGSVTHLQMEQYLGLTDTTAAHVPYKGESPLMIDLIGGRLQMAFLSYTSVGQHLQNGTIKALAVTLPSRSTLTPDVPTIAEAGVPKHDVVAWGGIFAPAGTPQPIVQKLNTAIGKTLRHPDVAAQLRAVGAEPNPTSAEVLAERVRRETPKWAEMARSLGIDPK